MAEDYYERLGVSDDATTPVIKQAYRDRIKETHPDVSDDKSASRHTKRLIEAKNVLTEPDERERYDRLGHDAYVTQSKMGPNNFDRTAHRSDARGTTPDGESTGPEATESAGNGGSESGSNQQAWGTAGSSNWSDTTSQTSTTGSDTGQYQNTGSSQSQAGNAGTSSQSANWYNTTPGAGSSEGDSGSHRAWETDRSYAVGDSAELFEPRSLLSSQRTIVLLGTTFLIYPVLLFGSLYQTFPTAVNLIVGLCTVLVISFLQSVPRVGILVFGIWTVLLPFVIFGFVGVNLLSLYGVIAMAAVVFPLGLSVLTWIAIRPTR